MAIIVEDGTIVDGANSFVSREDYITYAATLGVTVADDAQADIDLVKAAQYINSKEPQLKGYLVDRDQPMSFPRTNLTIDGFGWEDTEIPRQVILCQLNLALDIRAGIDPYNLPANPNRAVKREKVDVIEVEYVGGDSQAKLSRSSHWQALLSSLLRRNGLSIPLVRA